MALRPGYVPGAVFRRVLAPGSVWIVVVGHSAGEVVSGADVEPAGWVLKNVRPEWPCSPRQPPRAGPACRRTGSNQQSRRAGINSRPLRVGSRESIGPTSYA